MGTRVITLRSFFLIFCRTSLATNVTDKQLLHPNCWENWNPHFWTALWRHKVRLQDLHSGNTWIALLITPLLLQYPIMNFNAGIYMYIASTCLSEGTSNWNQTLSRWVGSANLKWGEHVPSILCMRYWSRGLRSNINHFIHPTSVWHSHRPRNYVVWFAERQ